MDATASSVAASTGRGRGAAAAGALGVAVGGAAGVGVAAICTRAVASFDGCAAKVPSGSRRCFRR